MKSTKSPRAARALYFRIVGGQPVPEREAGPRSLTIHQVQRRLNCHRASLLYLHEMFFPPARQSNPPMTFRVGPYKYHLLMVDKMIHFEGSDRLALAQSNGRLIRLWVGVDDRLNVLLHELRHCWGFHFPSPSTEEDECDFFAMIAQAAFEDIEQQGGVEALNRLASPESATAA